jgi:transposase-like protein
MCPPLDGHKYYTVMRQSKDPKYIRLEMVRYASEHGVKPTARAFGVSPQTVRKWLRRWQPGTLNGLEDLSRAPHSCPHRISAELEQRIVSLKKKLST